jgi:hypothetical protein
VVPPPSPARPGLDVITLRAGGGNPDPSDLGRAIREKFNQNLGAILPLAALFLFSGFFFGLFKFVLIAIFVLPPLFSVGFNFWAKSNLVEAPCPSCGQMAAGLKGEGFTQCFVCGSELSWRDTSDEWRLKSQYEDGPRVGGGVQDGNRDTTVIDVDASEVIDVDASEVIDV